MHEVKNIIRIFASGKYANTHKYLSVMKRNNLMCFAAIVCMALTSVSLTSCEDEENIPKPSVEGIWLGQVDEMTHYVMTFLPDGKGSAVRSVAGLSSNFEFTYIPETATRGKFVWSDDDIDYYTMVGNKLYLVEDGYMAGGVVAVLERQ